MFFEKSFGLIPANKNKGENEWNISKRLKKLQPTKEYT